MTTIDTSKSYVLTNNYTTTRYHLGAKLPDHVLMKAFKSSSQPEPRKPPDRWLFANTDRPGYYRLHSEETGFDKSSSLDVINDNGTNSLHVHLAKTGRYSGQYWRLDDWGDGTYKLTNTFTGRDRHLDVYSDTLQPHLAPGNCTGQHWTLEAVPAFVPGILDDSSQPTYATPTILTPNTTAPCPPSLVTPQTRKSMTLLASDLVHDLKLETIFVDGTTIHTHNTSDSGAGRRRINVEEKWERQEKLGNGTYGTVWVETCVLGPKKGELRAVKEILKEATTSESIDYGRELEAIAKFSHANYVHCFVKSYGWWETSNSVSIAMEYLKLGDLQKYLVVPFPEATTQEIVSQLVEGLTFMHDNGFAHRDLKPANILVIRHQPDWWVKIADFGISKRVKGGYITSLRTKVGTPAYTAPEVLGIFTLEDLRTGQTQTYTLAVDIWSLGVVTYKLLTNESPFPDPVNLSQYVTLGGLFPMTSLTKVKASSLCGNFVKNAMTASPSRRPSARDLSSSPWVKEASTSTASTGLNFEPRLNLHATADWSTVVSS